MTDWKSIAKARGVEIPDREMEQIARTLDALDAAFQPLKSQLEAGPEPAAAFSPEETGIDDPRSR